MFFLNDSNGNNQQLVFILSDGDGVQLVFFLNNDNGNKEQIVHVFLEQQLWQHGTTIHVFP
jgi:hypothetical protein